MASAHIAHKLCREGWARVSLRANPGLDLTTKRTRKREFLDEMNRVIPWGKLVGLVTRHAPEGKRGRLTSAVETILRIHFMQQWFTLSDPAMEEALHDVSLFREEHDPAVPASHREA